MVAGKVLAETQLVNGGEMRLGEECRRIPDQRELLHIGAAVRTWREVQGDTDLRYDWQSFVEIVRCSISHLAAGESTNNPL